MAGEVSGPIALEEAWKRLLSLATILDSETLAVGDCAGRFLAASLGADRTQPEHDLSAMDGFAVCGDGPWTVIGEARAGHPFSKPLQPQQAVAISTGAHCPEGTTSILIIENAYLDGTSLTATEAPVPGRHIRRAGLDFSAGNPLLASGTYMGPVEIALARAAGHGELSMRRRPQVTVIECGDELVGDPRNCPPGKLPASNGAMVAAMASAVGAEVVRIGPVPDNRSALLVALAEADSADLVITTGGASVGPHDLVRPALEALGAEIDFWKVAIRPGKPVLLARCETGLFLGLPGNPVSSFVTAYLFMMPLIRAMQGSTAPFPRPVWQTITQALPEGGERREFLRGCFADGGVTPLAERDSSALFNLSQADVLIDRAPCAPAVSSGSSVPCYLLRPPSIA